MTWRATISDVVTRTAGESGSLRLAEQVHSHNERVRFFVRYNEVFSGASHEIDPHLSEKLALCFGYDRVAGPGEEVDRGNRLGPRASAATACTPPRT